MSMNPFSIAPGWRVDPDKRQDRGNGEVRVRKMTEEELLKYGLKGDKTMGNKLPITTEDLLKICRKHGTGKEAYKIISETYDIGVKTAENQVYLKGIRKLLAAEKEERKKEAVVEEAIKQVINNQEEHPEPVVPVDIPLVASEEEYPDIKTNAEDISRHCSEEVKKCVCDISAEVDTMMEMDAVNHPKHYTAGKYEVIDIIESIVDSMGLTPFEGFCVGNALKYIGRWKNKGGVEDLNKAVWYLQKIISKSA